MRASHQRKYPTMTCGHRHKNSKGALGGITQQPTLKDAFPFPFSASRQQLPHTRRHREGGSGIMMQELKIASTKIWSFISYSRQPETLWWGFNSMQVHTILSCGVRQRMWAEINMQSRRALCKDNDMLRQLWMYISYSRILLGWHAERNSMKMRRLAARALQKLDMFSECFNAHSRLTGSSSRHNRDRILLCEWKESWWGLSLTGKIKKTTTKKKQKTKK